MWRIQPSYLISFINEYYRFLYYFIMYFYITIALFSGGPQTNRCAGTTKSWRMAWPETRTRKLYAKWTHIRHRTFSSGRLIGRAAWRPKWAATRWSNTPRASKPEMAMVDWCPASAVNYRRCSRTVLRSWEWAAAEEEATEMEATSETTITEPSLAELRIAPDSK